MVSATIHVAAQQDILVIIVKRVGWLSPELNHKGLSSAKTCLKDGREPPRSVFSPPCHVLSTFVKNCHVANVEMKDFHLILGKTTAVT